MNELTALLTLLKRPARFGGRLAEFAEATHALGVVRGVRAVIPCAGDGSRFGSTVKALAAGRSGVPVLVRVLDAVRNVTEDRPVVVVRAEHVEAIATVCSRAGHDVELVIQGARGMTEAVRQGLTALGGSSMAAMVCWGDVANPSAELMEVAVKVHHAVGAAVTMPTKYIRDPYVAIETHRCGGYTVRAQREGDHMPAVGLSDSSVFVFDAAAAQTLLTELIGARGGDASLVHILDHTVPKTIGGSRNRNRDRDRDERAALNDAPSSDAPIGDTSLGYTRTGGTTVADAALAEAALAEAALAALTKAGRTDASVGGVAPADPSDRHVTVALPNLSDGLVHRGFNTAASFQRHDAAYGGRPLSLRPSR